METTIHQRLKSIMKLKDLNSLSLSKVVGIANTTIGNMFLRNANPSFELITGIINAYNDINSEWLLTGKGEILKTSVQTTCKNEDNPYKLLYELQKENAELLKEIGDLKLENERLKNEPAIGRSAIAG